MKNKLNLTSTRTEAERLDQFVVTGSTDAQEEPRVRVNFEIPERLKIAFDVEAARTRRKKRELVQEIFEIYFAKREG
ncbi:MAG: hypothetical protein V3U27_09740 [Candidatus Tectomicrobia bacterium]